MAWVLFILAIVLVLGIWGVHAAGSFIWREVPKMHKALPKGIAKDILKGIDDANKDRTRQS